MELLYILYTYNRPAVTQECLRSLFANNDLKPERVVIIDDGSERGMKEGLARVALDTEAVVDLLSFKANVGYGRAAQLGFAVADMFQPRFCFFIETDYVFRKHGLDQVLEVLTSEIGSHCAGVAGYSHPDFYQPATAARYQQEMIRLHGRDNLNRELLFRPRPFASRFGPAELQFVSNSCGTMYLNWQLIGRIRQAYYPRMENEWIAAACNKGHPGAVLDDGILSQTLSYFWMEYARGQRWDTTRYGPLVDILPSVANHLCGAGLNAQGMPEGQTFVSSPTFPANYNE